MAPCIEKDQDARFRQHVIYYEMLEKGVKPLPEGDMLKEYNKFLKYVEKNNYKGFKDYITELYAPEREKALQKELEKKPEWRRWRWLRGWWEFWDSEFLRPYETLEYQRSRLVNIFRWDELDETLREHTKQGIEDMQWIINYQKKSQEEQ